MRITQRIFNFVLIILVVILLAAAGYLICRHYQPAGETPLAAVTAVPPDAQAAVAGVSAYYTIDYTETPAQWLQRLCQQLATEVDCAVQKMFAAPGIYTLAQKYKIQTASTVFPIRMVMSKTGTDGSVLHVWELQVTLSNPWPGATSPATVYADVIMKPSDHTWSMRHVLFDQEVMALQTAAP